MAVNIFTRAILRKPGKSFINAIAQDANREKPDYEKSLAEYLNYANTLEKMGVSVKMIEADEAFPDGNFVEDTHLILDDKIIIELNPGTPSRAGEPMGLSAHLPADIPKVALSKRYTIDGGDILQDGKKVYVGISKRTEQGAIDELAKIITPLGYTVKAIKVPQGLHLKSGMTCMKPNHFIIQHTFASILRQMQLEDPSIQFYIVLPEEGYVANVLAFNGKIMIAAGCPFAKTYISQYYAADDIYEVDTEQVRLVDGALTCSCLLLK